jgi:hypothetical protein
MEQEKKDPKLHEETEVALLRLDIASELVLLFYRNLSANWWWDGLEIKAQIDQDPEIRTRYNLFQAMDSGEFDPIKYPWKPYKLGYLEITPIDTDTPKPIDIKLVCTWSTVISFWKELESILRREFPVIDTKLVTPDRPETAIDHKPKEIEIPKRFGDLEKWKELYKTIRGWTGMGYNEISKKLRGNTKYSHLPSSPDTIAKVMRAGKARKLED